MTKRIKIKLIHYNGERPTKIVTTKDLEYTFPKFISFNTYDSNRLNRMLKTGKVNMIYDNQNRIHKIDNFNCHWHEPEIYRLKILSFSNGLIYDSDVKITAWENIQNFYKQYDIYKFFNEGLDIIIIIKDVIPIDIPTIY